MLDVPQQVQHHLSMANRTTAQLASDLINTDGKSQIIRINGTKVAVSAVVIRDPAAINPVNELSVTFYARSAGAGNRAKGDDLASVLSRWS